MKYYYWIKTNDENKCPLCGSPLRGCHLGEFCGEENCPYVDGMAALTDEEALKYKDLLIERVVFPSFSWEE